MKKIIKKTRLVKKRISNECEVFDHLISNVYPSGIVSIVSDTFDLWTVLTEYLPRLKDKILARDGKLVIRPDSGDPVKILCGYEYDQPESTLTIPEFKGVIELLWDVFGGTINDKGYKVLDPHVGAIYGDSITLQRAEDICKLLEEKGFCSTNVVFGIGSFTYQYNTRDTFGFAMKATWCQVNGVGYDIFKDPVTDDGTKKSAKGLVRVLQDLDEQFYFYDQVTKDEEETGQLQLVFENGKVVKETALKEIRERLK